MGGADMPLPSIEKLPFSGEYLGIGAFRVFLKFIGAQ